MANPFVQVEIGGDPKQIRFGFGSIAKIEAAFDGKAIGDLLERRSVGVILECLYQGLNHGKQKVTRAQLEAALDADPSKFAEYGTAIAKALTVALTGEELEGESGGKDESGAETPKE